jgi:hypothetical protein
VVKGYRDELGNIAERPLMAVMHIRY